MFFCIFADARRLCATSLAACLIRPSAYEHSSAEAQKPTTTLSEILILYFMKRLLFLAIFAAASIFAFADDINAYKKAAERGDVRAQWNLANCYYLGNGVARNLEQAVYWYQKAAEQNMDMAQNDLGICYYFGYGTSVDYKRAFGWFVKAAESGFAAAQYNLGVCYHNGDGVNQDVMQAIYWYRKAAEQNYEPALDILKKLELMEVEPQSRL